MGSERRVQQLTTSVAIGEERTWLDLPLAPPGREKAEAREEIPHVSKRLHRVYPHIIYLNVYVSDESICGTLYCSRANPLR